MTQEPRQPTRSTRGIDVIYDPGEEDWEDEEDMRPRHSRRDQMRIAKKNPLKGIDCAG